MEEMVELEAVDNDGHSRLESEWTRITPRAESESLLIVGVEIDLID